MIGRNGGLKYESFNDQRKSPQEGCTFTALSEIADTLTKEGIESEILHLGTDPIRDCIACGKCSELGGKCVFDDDMVNRKSSLRQSRPMHLSSAARSITHIQAAEFCLLWTVFSMQDQRPLPSSRRHQSSRPEEGGLRLLLTY